MFTRLVLLTLLVIAAFAITAFRAISPPETLCGALAMGGTVAGIQAVVGALISLLIEYWSGWKELPPKSKRPIIFGLCLVVPILSLVVSVYVCDVELTKDAIYLAALTACIAFTTADFTHIRKLPPKKRVEPSE